MPTAGTTPADGTTATAGPNGTGGLIAVVIAEAGNAGVRAGNEGMPAAGQLLA